MMVLPPGTLTSSPVQMAKLVATRMGIAGKKSPEDVSYHPHAPYTCSQVRERTRVALTRTVATKTRVLWQMVQVSTATQPTTYI